MSVELLTALKDLGPYGMFFLIAAMYFWVRNKEAAAAVVRAQADAEASKNNTEAERIRDTRHEADKAAAALIQLQIVTAIAGITAQQKLTRGAVFSIEDHMLDAFKASEATLGDKVEDVRQVFIEGLAVYQTVSSFMLGLLMKNPPAGLDQIKRMLKAWAAGDLAGAQAVADEDIPVAAKAEPPVALAPAPEGLTQ
jgi:hypothetical protein